MRDIQNQKYGAVAMALHWLMAGLIIFNLVEAKLTRGLAREVRSAWLYQHKAVGVLVLVLIVWRLIWRLTHKIPPLPAGTTRFAAFVAHAGHWALYAFMVFVPLMGLSRDLLRGRETGLWLFSLPSPFAENAGLAKIFGQSHDLSGNLLILLVGGHILAALFHQFYQRDHLISRMMPGSASK